MTRTILLSALLLTGCIMPPMTQSGTGPTTASGSEPSESAPSEYESESRSAPAMGAPRQPERASAPAAPQTASVTIRSACSKTAKVFYGDKPGFSSGTQSSISSNSVQSKTFRIGDQMWVTDDSGKALDSVRVESGTRNIEILSSCSSISSR